MYKVLVLGGEGMLGQLVRHFLSNSKQLMVKHTHRRQVSDPFYYDAEAGLDGLQQILERNHHFDYFINCIGVLNHQIDEQNSQSLRHAIFINGLLPHELAALAQETRTRVIHISTDGVFARNAGTCLEDSPRNCNDAYGKTKSLGEVIGPDFLNIRCSIIGPNSKRQGLFEWFRSQPSKATVQGYTNHVWNGVTTLQFAQLCRQLILQDLFDTVRDEGPIHHFCPNQIVSKYELLQLFRTVFRSDITVEPVTSQGGSVYRILDTRYQTLKRIFGYGRPMRQAIEALATLYEEKL